MEHRLSAVLRQFRQRKGFTLIELLIVIAIIAILAVIVLIAVNPQRQVRQAVNTQRANDARSLLDGVSELSADAAGALPDNVAALADDTLSVLGTCAAGATCVDADANSNVPAGWTLNGACINLTGPDLIAARAGNQALVPTYIAALPADPETGGDATAAAGLGYAIGHNVNDRVTVVACGTRVPPADATITVTR